MHCKGTRQECLSQLPVMWCRNIWAWVVSLSLFTEGFSPVKYYFLHVLGLLSQSSKTMYFLLPTVFKELYQRRPPRLCSLLWREAEADVCQWDKDTATQLAGAAGMRPSLSSPGNWGSGFKPFTVTRTMSLSGQVMEQQNAYFCQEFSCNSNILHSPYILDLLQSVLKINPFGCISTCKLNVCCWYWGQLAQSKPQCVFKETYLADEGGCRQTASCEWSLGHVWGLL